MVAVCVDPPGRCAAFARRWHLPYPILSDPGGESILKPLDRWNPDERGGIGKPGIFLLALDGTEAFRYRSRDFADRPDDDDLMAALETLSLPPVDLPPWEPDAAPEEHPDAFRTDAFGGYFRGVRSGATALAMRAREDADRNEALGMLRMASSFLDAWKARREAAGA